MTVTQLLVLLIAGPLALLQALSAIAYCRFEYARFELVRAVVLVAAIAAIVIAFAGLE